VFEVIENYQIVLIGKENSEMRTFINELYIPNKVFLSAEVEKTDLLFEGKRIKANACQIYICSESQCYEPQQSLNLIKLLTKN